MIRVDLQAPIISSAMRCWRLFPGSHYKFLKTFIENDVAFLDIPGFPMPDGKLADAKDLQIRLRTSEIVLEKISRDGKEKTPTVSEDEIKKFRVGKKRQRNQQAIINFFDEAKKGDIVVTPDQLVSGIIWIGEIRDNPNSSVSMSVPASYGEVSIPSRRVRWLKSIQESAVSRDLSGSLRHQHPFSLLERSLFLEVFSLTFDSYVFGEHHSSVIFNRKNDYLDRDSALIGAISSLSAKFCEAVEENSAEAIDPLVAILSHASIEYHCSQAMDIHSPGFQRFTSSMKTALVIAAVVAAISAISGCDSASEVNQAVSQIEFVNTAAPPDDPCTAVVSKTADRILKSLGSDNLLKMCESMRDAQERAGLESSAKTSRIQK